MAALRTASNSGIEMMEKSASADSIRVQQIRIKWNEMLIYRDEKRPKKVVG